MPPRLLLRRLHLYVGVTIAPSVLFFALTGCLQLFTLHEAHGDYRPLPVIEKLGMLHKDQVFVLKPKRPASARTSGAVAAPQETVPMPSVLALKTWFLGVGLGLVLTTSVGLWIAFTQAQNKGLVWTLLAAGSAIPFALAVLGATSPG